MRYGATMKWLMLHKAQYCKLVRHHSLCHWRTHAKEMYNMVPARLSLTLCIQSVTVT